MGKTNVDIAKTEQIKSKRTKERAKATEQINELKSLFKQVQDDNQSPARYELDYAIEIGESHLTLLGSLEAQLRDTCIEDAESTHTADLHRAIGLGNASCRACGSKPQRLRLRPFNTRRPSRSISRSQNSAVKL